MSRTKIEWATDSWNPITGCSPISDGCLHCYASRMATRLAGRFGYPGNDPFVPTLHPSKITEPLHWTKPRRIFAGSMTDVFHEQVPCEWVDKMMAVIACCPQHTFMILTKRPTRMRKYIDELEQGKRKVCSSAVYEIREGIVGALLFKKWTQESRPNLWIGVTAENQDRANERIPILLSIPAAVRFVSIEPMLGPVDLQYSAFNGADSLSGIAGINWVICGPENGAGKRPCDPAWIRRVSDQCQQASIPFFDKRGILRREIPKITLD